MQASAPLAPPLRTPMIAILYAVLLIILNVTPSLRLMFYSRFQIQVYIYCKYGKTARKIVKMKSNGWSLFRPFDRHVIYFLTIVSRSRKETLRHFEYISNWCKHRSNRIRSHAYLLTYLEAEKLMTFRLLFSIEKFSIGSVTNFT